jgi:hypothetical protein
MITPFDDYPIHQTALPIAHPASGDRNHYDRTFFNGFDVEAPMFFGVAMGIYPNRGVIDAAFTVVRDGIQRSVFASGRAPADRAQAVGALAIEVIEPLRRARVTVRGTADLVWQARTAALEEPRQTIHDGSVLVMDATRLVQWGTWTGWIDVDGERIAVEALPGTKDRSWGIRPVGEPAGGAPTSAIAGGGLFMTWAPVHFDDHCTHAVIFERPDGWRWYESAAVLGVLGPGDATWEVEQEHAREIGVDVDFRPGTRRPRAATLTYPDRSLSFEPVLDVPMKGLGYWHPDWAHGWWRGELAEGTDSWKLDELDPLAFENLHVEQLCRVRAGEHTGVGVLETLIIGPHVPSGFTDLLDGAR